MASTDVGVTHAPAVEDVFAVLTDPDSVTEVVDECARG